MVGKKRGKQREEPEVPVDLASRIGGAGAPEPTPVAAPEPLRRVDGPLEPARTPRRDRPAMIGLEEASAGPTKAPAGRPAMIGLDEVPAPRAAARATDRPAAAGAMLIGLDEVPAAPIAPHATDRPAAAGAMLIGLEESFQPPPPPIPDPDAAPVAAAIPAAPREAPSVGELDLVVTPLATPDDWHHFELALRRVPGVGTLRTEYYRAGILKLRLRWSGAGRLAQALATLPGYRVGVLGEDRTTLQIRVTRA